MKSELKEISRPMKQLHSEVVGYWDKVHKIERMIQETQDDN